MRQKKLLLLRFFQFTPFMARMTKINNVILSLAAKGGERRICSIVTKALFNKKSGLFFIVLAGFLLRIYGIGFGLPFQFHQDEPIIVNHALAYGTGDFNPHFFAIPPFTSYLLFFIYVIMFVLFKFMGIVQNVYEFGNSFFTDPTWFYLTGRFFLGVIPGTISIWFVYFLYKSIFRSSAGALTASSIMAFSFLNIVNSHYIYVDTLMICFIIICLNQIIRLKKNYSLKNYMLTGLFIGCCAAVKYNAVIIAVPFLIAQLFRLQNKKSILNYEFFLGIFVSVLVFFGANFSILLNFKDFIVDILKQGHAEGYIGWSHHLFYSIRESIGLFFLILGLIGVVFSLIKNSRNALIFFSFPIFFYLHLVFFSQNFPRYTLALIPFFAISASYVWFEVILPKIQTNLLRSSLFGCLLLSFALLTAKAIKADILFSSKDTRIGSAEWIEKNINKEQKIAVDHTFFRPAIFQNAKQIEQKYSLSEQQSGMGTVKRSKLDMLMRVAQKRKGFYIYYLNPDPEAQGKFLFSVPSLPFDYEKVKRTVDFVVINYANRMIDDEFFYNELKERAELIANFSPYKDNSVRFSKDLIATTCLPIDSEELYSRKANGPALEIYKIGKNE